MDVAIEPATSSTNPVAAPPPNVFFQARPSPSPLTRPSRFAGADGATGTFTCSRTSFDAGLLSAPSCPCMRMKNDPDGATNVKMFDALPVGMLASTCPGATPPSRTKTEACGPTVNVSHRSVTVLPETASTRKLNGGCTVVGAATAMVTVATLPGPVAVGRLIRERVVADVGPDWCVDEAAVSGQRHRAVRGAGDERRASSRRHRWRCRWRARPGRRPPVRC